MSEQLIPAEVLNWIDGRQVPAGDGGLVDKLDPASGALLCRLARSGREDVDRAVESAARAQAGWAALTPVRRGEILYAVAAAMEESAQEIAAIVAKETGKSPAEALGETGGAIALARFFAGEGQRLYGRTLTSAVPGRQALTLRQPLGVAGLIIAANTPIANVAWKVFPALICGNAAVLKAAEDTPATAWIVGRVARRAGLPDGVLNIIQGLGPEAGAPLVRHPQVPVISFTGSAAVGREIAVACGQRLAKVSLELGGKNPLVVCDDADLENACRWVLLSAFSNAGQRCAAAGRIIIFQSIYPEFRDMLLKATAKLKLGPNDGDDLGPVINQRQLDNMLAQVERAQRRGARVLCGGRRLDDPEHAAGFYMAPTLIEEDDPDSEIARTELFGPIALLFAARDFEQALELANRSPYGLTACIHTQNLHRALEFCNRVQAGVAVVNAGTYGSEPHMPFGGLKDSGNGTREPGTEALDIYSELKNVYLHVDPEKV